MVRSLKSLSLFSLGGIDCEIGKVKDFYFEDDSWIIRYCIVDTGDWLPGKKVLISVQSLISPDWENEILETNLSLGQIKSSPDIETDVPVSRQQELKLYKHFPWRIYWGPGMGSKGSLMPLTESVKAALANDSEFHKVEPNPHLRSSDKLIGYGIQALDGDAGKLTDFVVDTDRWEVDYLIVDVGSWLSAEKVLLPVNCVNGINWATSTIHVSISKEAVLNSPDFNDVEPVNRINETTFLDYLGRISS